MTVTLYTLFIFTLALLPSFTASQNASVAYTPLVAPCPRGFSLIRKTSILPSFPPILSASEESYILKRKLGVLPKAWKAYLSNVKAANPTVTLPRYVTDILGGFDPLLQPTLGIATSGGGYRAAIFGAGVLNTLDARNTTSATGGTGGLLQAASYLSALSGGGWLVTSLAQADFPTIHDLIFGSPAANTSGWLAQYGLLQPTGNTAEDFAYVEDVILETKGKHDAGWPIGIADVWSRALSRHFITGTTVADIVSPGLHGAGVTFSGIADLPSFKSHSQPFPILIADLSSKNGDTSEIITNDYIPLTNPIFEFNVYETGSFDPNLAAFTPTKYLGTQNTTTCITKFDQASYIAGISSNLFNEYNTSASAFLSSPVGPVIELLESFIPQPSTVPLDVALVPNAFQGMKAKKSWIDENEEYLGLVDGGEDGEIIPIQPLLVKSRGVDVIVTVDATASGPNLFADGSSMIATQRRAALFSSQYSFPTVPNTTADFVPLLNRPTFFGCASKHLTTPLIIYLPNSAPRDGTPAVTNTTTSQFTYPPDELQSMLDQTYDIATQGFLGEGQSAKDPEWSACLACAVVDRARARIGQRRTGVCETCFERYCWSG